MLTVTFEGLCALHEGADQWNVYTPIGSHHPHVSLLVIAGSDLDAANTSWLPDLTTNEPRNGEQVCIWRLAGTRIRLSPGGVPTWAGDPAPVVNFSTINTGSRFLPGPAAMSGGVIHLGAGTVSVADDVKANPRLTVAKGQDRILTQQFADRISWTGAPLVGTFKPASDQRAYLENLNTTGKIVFRTDLGASVCVTNSLPSRNALTHFHSYYELIERAPGDPEATMFDADENAKTGINCIPTARMPL